VGSIAFGHLAPDRQNRVQRGHRLLEDHRDLVAADLLDVAFADRRQVEIAVADLAGGDAPGREGISRMIDSAVTLLPEPDSPTIAKVSPPRLQ
jgi:hypothetical protein